METTLRMVAIDIERDGTPRDSKITAALQVFYNREFGCDMNFSYYLRVWVILAIRVEDPEYFEVVGVTAMRNQPDCPVFHLVPLTQDKEGLRFVEQARDLAVYRMHSYLQDLGMSGSTVLIYVSETAQRYWKRFLSKIKAKPGNRFEMKI